MSTNYSTFFQDFSVGIIIVNDDDLIIVESNPAFTEISGYTRNSLLGRSLTVFFADCDISHSPPRHIEGYCFHHADGKQKKYVDITISAIPGGARSHLAIMVHDVTELTLRLARINSLNRVYLKSSLPQNLFFRSSMMKELYKETLRLHHDKNRMVLIQGERGTEKEIVAALIHFGRSNDCSAPFIQINCATTPPEHFESDLLGYENKKGSPGKLELARGGTIFMNGIEKIPSTTLNKLLNAVKDRDLRLVFGASHNFEEQMKVDSLSKELYLTLAVNKITVPPLRDREEDIASIANHFLRYYSNKWMRRFKTFSKRAMEILLAYKWPGNVRELKNVLERIILVNDDTIVRSAHLSSLNTSADSPATDMETINEFNTFQIPSTPFDLKSFERKIVRETLKKFDGNKTRAAQYLGLTRSALRSRLEE